MNFFIVLFIAFAVVNNIIGLNGELLAAYINSYFSEILSRYSRYGWVSVRIRELVIESSVMSLMCINEAVINRLVHHVQSTSFQNNKLRLPCVNERKIFQEVYKFHFIPSSLPTNVT